MKYDFIITGGPSLNLTSGQIEASEPGIAMLRIVSDNTDILDDDFGPALAPDIVIHRNPSGTFGAHVDTHGLDDFWIRLKPIA